MITRISKIFLQFFAALGNETIYFRLVLCEKRIMLSFSLISEKDTLKGKKRTINQINITLDIS